MPERYISPSLRNNRRLSAIVGNLTGVEAAIHDRIWNAILDRKLRPGAKLHEDMVGNAFGVSRTIVRKVFLIMEQEGIISLPLNRGAFVATPTPEEIRPLFETLRLTMPYIIRNLVETLDDDGRARLEAHFQVSDDLEQSQEARLLRRLAQEHFILMADLYGNPVLATLIERITTRVSMALTLYQDPISTWRPAESNRLLNQAILDRDADKAVEFLMKHLDLIEATIQFESPESTFDIGSILLADDEPVYPKARKGSKSRQRKVKVVTDGLASSAKHETQSVIN